MLAVVVIIVLTETAAQVEQIPVAVEAVVLKTQAMVIATQVVTRMAEPAALEL
jgi:hypothetical protein